MSDDQNGPDDETSDKGEEELAQLDGSGSVGGKSGAVGGKNEKGGTRAGRADGLRDDGEDPGQSA